MNRLPRILTLLIGLLGAAIAGYLTYTHFQIFFDPEFQSGCNLGGSFNCDAVNSSSFSEIFGIPIALVGVAFYLVIVALSALSLAPGREGPRVPAVIWGLSALAFFLSVGLAYVSGAIIGAWCLFCMSLYAVNAALLATSWWAAGMGFGPLVRELDQELRAFYKSPAIYVTAATFFGALLFGTLYYNGEVQSATDAARLARTAEFSQAAAEQAAQEAQRVDSEDAEALKVAQAKQVVPEVTLALRGDEPFKGGADAKVVIVEFADFECPFCSLASDTLYSVADRFGDRVKIIYKHYPLDQSCNALVDRRMHEHACDASIASICAQEQGRFWDYHRILFANQRDLDQDDLVGYAEKIGLDVAAWERCRRAPQAMARLQSDIDAAVQARLSGTPSIFINGRPEKSQAIRDPELMAAIIEDALKTAEAP